MQAEALQRRRITVLKIGVGSLNPVKLNAVREVARLYPQLKDAEVIAIDAHSHVSHQPTTLEETIVGAKNRAAHARSGNDMGLGIESGLMSLPDSEDRYMDVCICAMASSRSWGYALGLSPGFELPHEVVRYVLDDGLDLNEACKKAGLTSEDSIGSRGGAISILTSGRITRLEYTKQAVIMALVQHEFAERYRLYAKPPPA